MTFTARAIVASLALACVSAPSAHAQYVARDLGSLPGAFYTSAADVNARGDAVGVSSALPSGHAVLWTGGGIAEIPGLSTAVAINNRGQIVGDGVVPSGDLHGFVFERGVLTDLGTLPGLPASRVADVNERGDIAGISYQSGGSELEMVLWVGGAIQDLGPLPLGEGVVKAINERRQIVGYSQNPSVTRAWVWQEGVVTMLPLPDGARDSFAWDINDRGDIVGVAIGDLATHAVLWPAGGGVIDLGTLPGHSGSWAQGVNNRGQVVGWSADADGYHAFLWRAGTMVELDTLPGHTQAAASAISDAGAIVGESIAADFSRRATMWTLAARDR
jgi:probable HAF family extracellular repeat protein